MNTSSPRSARFLGRSMSGCFAGVAWVSKRLVSIVCHHELCSDSLRSLLPDSPGIPLSMICGLSHGISPSGSTRSVTLRCEQRCSTMPAEDMEMSTTPLLNRWEDGMRSSMSPGGTTVACVIIIIGSRSCW